MPRLRAYMTSLNGCHTLLGTTTGTGYNNHPATVFALSLHWSSDSVGCSIWKQKSLPGFDDLDETRRIWPRPASFFRFLGGQRMFNRFPSQTPHLLFFSLLVRAACMASETVRCFGDGNYPRDLTNFFGHSFLAFANGIGSESGLGLEKEMGWMIFQYSMGVLFWSASSCVRPRLLTPSRFVFYLYNEFFYIFIFRSRSKYLRSFLRRMRRWMGRMEEEKTKQNN
jgi:hypothetical protein